MVARLRRETYFPCRHWGIATKLLCTSHFHKTPALLHLLFYFQMCHLSERLSRWPPGPFPVPTFAFDVELKLDGNAEYEKNNTHHKLTRDLKHHILDKLASIVYGFKAYPSDKEIEMVAEALVAKHPCLKKAGSETGWNGWKYSIKFKMGNYRNNMRWAGCQEVTVNSGKRSSTNPENEPSHSNIKRPKQAEVNFLPNFAQRKGPSSLEQLRQTIVEEVKKTEKNLPLIRKMLETTFPLRRETIVLFSTPANELMDLGPALKIESELIWMSFKVKIVILTHFAILPSFKSCCCILLLLLFQFSCMQSFSGLWIRTCPTVSMLSLIAIFLDWWPFQTEGIKNWEDSRCFGRIFLNPRWTGQ